MESYFFIFKFIAVRVAAVCIFFHRIRRIFRTSQSMYCNLVYLIFKSLCFLRVIFHGLSKTAVEILRYSGRFAVQLPEADLLLLHLLPLADHLSQSQEPRRWHLLNNIDPFSLIQLPIR